MRPPAVVRLVRPHQWYKNLIVYIPLVFSNNATNVDLWLPATVCFAAFCLLSGAAYAWNDVLDADGDRLHPKKRARPVASGAVSPLLALVLGGIAAVAGLLLVTLTRAPAPTLLLGATYLILQLGYNVVLKHHVVADVIAIGLGFVLRALAGTTAIDVGDPTVWLILCTFLFALFLGFAKRRHELLLLAPAGSAAARGHRNPLGEYTVPLVEQLTQISATLLLAAYFLYTFFGSPTAWMMATIPFAVYGVFRYLFLVHRRDLGDEPELIFRDRPTLLNAAAWIVTVALVLKGVPQDVMTWLQGL